MSALPYTRLRVGGLDAAMRAGGHATLAEFARAARLDIWALRDAGTPREGSTIAKILVATGLSFEDVFEVVPADEDEVPTVVDEEGCDSCGARRGCRCDEIVDQYRDADIADGD